MLCDGESWTAFGVLRSLNHVYVTPGSKINAAFLSFVLPPSFHFLAHTHTHFSLTHTHAHGGLKAVYFIDVCLSV